MLLIWINDYFRLERLVEPLRITVTSKVKTNSVKQEFEKQDELKRSAMRAIAALLTIPDADKNPQLADFVAHIKSTPELQALYDSIQRDACPSHEAMMDLSWKIVYKCSITNKFLLLL